MITPVFPVRRSRVAAPATISALHYALKDRLATVAANFSTLETKTTTRAPVIFDGWVPPKPIEGEQFPFFLVKPRSGIDTEQAADQTATVTVEIVAGTFSDTDDGWIDVMLLIDAIRHDLGSQPAIEGTAFEQTGPMTWTLDEQQPRPQWLGSVFTIWTIPRPRRVERLNPPEGRHDH